ncbi:MAG: hypothetical protein FWD66_07995 [Paludibacter sp.]|nr:hypothetical protein [Paludibacter sp.]
MDEIDEIDGIDGIDRIKQVMESVKMNRTQFSKEINVNGATISLMLNRSPKHNLKPTVAMYTKILNRFPQFNSDWLIFGNEPMTKNPSKSEGGSLPLEQQEIFSQSDTCENEKSVEKSPEKTQKQNFTTELEKKSVENLAEINSQLREIIKYTIEKEIPVSKSVTKVIVYFSDNTFKELV